MSDARSLEHVRSLTGAVGDRAEPVSADTAFATLYKAAFPRVYAVVRCQVATVDAAQEIVSRVFLKVYQNRDRIPAGDGALNWVFHIARNTLIDYRRVEGRRERATVPVDELHHLASSDESPEEEYEVRRQASDLLQVVSDLPDGVRMILTLKFVADRTNREIASILGISEAAVAMRLLRALRSLRERLQSIGWHDGR